MSRVSTRELLRQALNLHRSGQLAQAELLYRTVLDDAPQDTDALRMLGVLRRQIGDLQGSIDLLTGALDARPGDVASLVELSASLVQAGQYSEAELALGAAIGRKPAVPEVWLILAEAQAAQQKLEAAQHSISRALKLRPGWPDALHVRGAVQAGLGQPQEAEATFRELLASQPGNAELRINLAHSLRQQSRFAEAAEAYRAAVAMRPNHAALYSDLGVTLAAAGNDADAVMALEHSIRLEPQSAQNFRRLADVHREAGRLEEAVAAYRQSIGLFPADVESRLSMVRTLTSLNRLQDAMSELQALLRLVPDSNEAFDNLLRLSLNVGAHAEFRAFMLAEADRAADASAHYFWLGAMEYGAGRHDEALASYRRAAELADGRNPRIHSDARLNAALLLLERGDREEGWSEFRWRNVRQSRLLSAPKIPADPAVVRQLPKAATIALRSEQGIGDELFFLRFAPGLRAAGHRLLLAAHPKLASVLRGQALPFELIGADGADADLELLTGDLPAAGGISHAPPLGLDADTAHVRAVGARLADCGPAPYIAVTWRGGIDPEHAQRLGVGLVKQVPSEELGEALRGMPGTVLVIQRLPQPLETAAFERGLGRPSHDFSDLNDDLPRMLALLSLVDDYVTVSNTNVHLLAGLPRKQAHVLVPLPGEWRWPRTGTESPWFPGYRAYHQLRRGEWKVPLERLRADLRSAFPGMP